MIALIKPFVEICLLRLRPQDLPASGLLLGAALVAHTISAALVSIVSLPLGRALLAGITDTLLLGLLTVSALYLQRRQTRAQQTLTALAGCGTILGILALPVIAWLHTASQAGRDLAVPGFLLLILVGWSLTVAGHVLRHALSTAFIFGLVLALVFYWISVNILKFLFPIAL